MLPPYNTECNVCLYSLNNAYEQPPCRHATHIKCINDALRKSPEESDQGYIFRITRCFSCRGPAQYAALVPHLLPVLHNVPLQAPAIPAPPRLAERMARASEEGDARISDTTEKIIAFAMLAGIIHFVITLSDFKVAEGSRDYYGNIIKKALPVPGSQMENHFEFNYQRALTVTAASALGFFGFLRTGGVRNLIGGYSAARVGISELRNAVGNRALIFSTAAVAFAIISQYRASS